jgi:hypothetical protein
MSGIRVVRTKGTNYSIAVTCPICDAPLEQKNKNKEDKFYRVFALYCEHCRATFSFGLVLRTETYHNSAENGNSSRGAFKA